MGKIKFKINGVEHSVGDKEVSSDMTLVDYLRTRLELRGTKYMCREGGCGACIVSAVTSPGAAPVSVNSCLTLITQCHEWEITTIEKVGNKRDGYHPIQETLANNHGTQCGACTPGWVMAMYNLAQVNKKPTQLDIEKSFASNICRCTGYRPIMEAFKKFAIDAPDSQIADIEDLYVCKKTNKPCQQSCVDDDDWCFLSDLSIKEEEPIQLELKDGKKWYKVKEINQIFQIILNTQRTEDYMLVCGNTIRGVFPIVEFPDIMIDVSGVSALQGHTIDQNLIVAANNTLTNFSEILKTISVNANFKYLLKIYEHITSFVAHIPVRNVGSIAGNLMTKHKRNNFASDIFLLLETVGAYVTILNSDSTQQRVSMQDFLKTDMNKKILYNVLLPPLNDEEFELVTYKIMPRAQNGRVIVNAGFLYELKKPDNIVLEARIVLGNLSPTFIRATKTEGYLKGKRLFENNTLQSALTVLDGEMVVAEDSMAPSVAYRKKLALSLFYKGLLTLYPKNQLNVRYQSGSKQLHSSRPVSKAKQEFKTVPSLYPLNQPIPKVEGMIQCAGEAPYTDDLPAVHNEVFSALVLTTVARGNIVFIDPSEALKIPGVIVFYSAKDIPGKNSFLVLGLIIFVKDEEVFCSDEVSYYNQPLGMIVAESTALAERAATKVKVTYKNVTKPVIDIKEAKEDSSRTKKVLPVPAIGRGLFVAKKFQSSYTIHSQFHFCMENIVCVSKPSEFGLEVHCTTHWMDGVQHVIAKALDIETNRVDVFTRRVGGSFGLKVSRPGLTAVACSLAAYKLNRPCRMVQSFNTTARSVGKRYPNSCDVDVQVSRRGRIQKMSYKMYGDNGYIVSELLTLGGLTAHSNCYNRLWWDYILYDVTTDTAKNTYCRAPSTLESIAMTETIMEQISYELSLDPFDVRMENLNDLNHRDIRRMGNELKEKAEYDKRLAEVKQFNAETRWKKRGLGWAFMRYTAVSPDGFEVTMSVSHTDGCVTINHGGIELGQGINTKALQICAYFLKIPIDKIKVKPHNTLTAPNSIITGGSTASQNIGIGVEKCCKQLLDRLKLLRTVMLNPSWESLIKTAFLLKIDLQARYYVGEGNLVSPIFPVYGVTLSEVEVDILTGECQVLRVDLYEDVGQSVSPQIDVGQVEGAFIMGLSYWLIEDMIYDKNTGEVLSNRPYNYPVVQCRDIPQDFRVSFRENSYSDDVVLGAKVTGEQAICMAISVPFAMRRAIASAREESKIPTTEWFSIDGTWTPEKVCLATKTNIKDYLFTS